MRDATPRPRVAFRAWSWRRAFGSVVLLAVAGCAATGAGTPPRDYPDTVTLEREYRVERVAKRDGEFTVYPSGFAKIAGRGIVRLYQQRDDDLLILIPVDPDGPVHLAPPLPALHTIEPARRDGVALVAIGNGLPRAGQWRERFTLTSMDARPGVEIVTSPARKSNLQPRVFGFDPVTSAWTRQTLQFPSRMYDYGSSVHGDFDGDGRTDIAVAMHMQGFAAFVVTPDGVVERSNGLPTASGPLQGSGRVLLSHPAPDGDRLLLLREPMFARPGIGLREMQLRDGRWQDTGFSDDTVAGERMALSADTRCGRWLAVADSRSNSVRLWRFDAGRWHAQALDGVPARRVRIADLAFGDFDGDGCDDLAVAYAPFVPYERWGSVDVYLARAQQTWSRMPVWQKQERELPSAIGFVAQTGAGARLAVLDDAGGLRLFSRDGDTVWLDHEQPPSDWVKGCSGSALVAGDVDGDGSDELVAAFAGEPTSLELQRCSNGGGFDAWKLVSP